MAEVHDTAPVRPGEGLPLDRLAAYLERHIEGIGKHSLEVEQFTAGHSNLTYLLKSGAWEGVLRRPPFGKVAPKAHDMGRESRWLTALHPLFPLAPKPYVFCDDVDVLGAPFFVMERRRGVVIDKEWPQEYPQTAESAVALAETLVETLVQLHAVDYKETPVANLVHPDGYLERQVQGLINRYGLAKTEHVAEAPKVGNWLTDHLPKTPAPSIIHNDLKLNNMIFDMNDPRRATAVLDWEMATVGDPLSDLAILLSYWCESSDPPLFRKLVSPLTTLPGFPTRSHLIEQYAKQSGRDMSNIHYYLVFAYFKSAVICQQIYYRFAQGQTQDSRFAMLGVAANELVRTAYRYTSQSAI